METPRETFKENVKNYFLRKHAEHKLNSYKRGIPKTIPWIQRQTLTNTLETHCRVLLNTLTEGKRSFSETKLFIDNVLKYTFNCSESLLADNKRVKDLKTFMQLNSFIVFNETEKGLRCSQSKKAIKFNIEKRLAHVMEDINAKTSPSEILEDLCK